MNHVIVDLHSGAVHVGVKENLNKRDEKTKDEVKVNHLNIGSGRQAVGELNINIASYIQELIHKRKVKITFMNRVVSTSKTVRLTVTIASKKKFLK